MNQASQLLIVASAAAMLIASRREHRGAIEPGEGDYVAQLQAFDPVALVDRAENVYHQLTEQAAEVSIDVATLNVGAFLAVLRRCEGTEGQADPYAVCYGYKHTVQSFADHPAVTGEWTGERLSDAMCENAGFGPGCKSTAAGAYQLIKPTWLRMRDALGLVDFSAPSQDAAALELVRRRGALEDLKAGRFLVAVHKCRNEWASLPGNYARQGQRTPQQIVAWYAEAGGNFA
jgi:muramidase (phage lysozyme)